MSDDAARDLVDGLLKLGALNVQIAGLMSEAGLAACGVRNRGFLAAAPQDAAPSDVQIEAVALVIEQQLLGNFDLGFQAMLRLNFPRDQLREMAVKALNAAHEAASNVRRDRGNDAG